MKKKSIIQRDRELRDEIFKLIGKHFQQTGKVLRSISVGCNRKELNNGMFYPTSYKSQWSYPKPKP